MVSKGGRRAEERIGLSGDAGLGVKARAISDQEFNTKLKQWTRQLTSCKSALGPQSIILTVRIKKSGLVGDVRVKTQPEQDPELERCIQNTLKKKVFHPLPQEQSFDRNVTL